MSIAEELMDGIEFVGTSRGASTQTLLLPNQRMVMVFIVPAGGLAANIKKMIDAGPSVLFWGEIEMTLQDLQNTIKEQGPQILQAKLIDPHSGREIVAISVHQWDSPEEVYLEFNTSADAG